jgi:hypothetical protein
MPSPAGMFIYSSCGKWPFPPLQWSFPPIATFTSFPAPSFLGRCLHSSLLRPACLFTVLWGISPPPPPNRLRGWGRSALFATCVCCCCCLFSLFFFFSFFPGWWSVCPGGYADLAQGCLWEYRMPLSSPCGLRLPKWPWSWCLAVAEALLVSPFNMKWGWYAWAGGVEESKFSVFSVVFPTRLCLQRLSKILF